MTGPGSSLPAARVADLLPSVAAALGRGLRRDLAGFAGGRAALDLGSPRKVCVVLVDGLGYYNLAERGGHAPTLRRALAGGLALQAPYPSTTAASLATLGTGELPGRTGMLGYTVRNPATGQLANLVQWTGVPAPESWQRMATVLERLARAKVTVTSVGPARFEDSGMTRAALRGGVYRAAESLSARVDAALDQLRQDGLVYLYWGDVDKSGHHHGWGSRQWGEALEQVDAELGRLVRAAPTGTTVLLTADHGMIDADFSQRWDVGEVSELSQGVELIAGEPRAVHVHVTDSADPEDVARRWQVVLGEAGTVMTRSEAIGRDLFGPVDPAVLPIIGDVVVAMSGRATVVDSRTQTPASLSLTGLHGSWTQTEMTVPLLRWES